MRLISVRRLSSCVAVLVLNLAAGAWRPAWGASDARFFGTYCGTYTEPVTIDVPCFPLFPWWLCPVTHHIDLAVEVHADYLETNRRNGLVHGSGHGEVKRHDLPDSLAGDYGIRVGRRVPFVFSGRVTGPGQAAVSAVAPGRESTHGRGTLSADGVELELEGLDRTVTLRKDGCNNTAPTATIEQPAEATIPWHQVTMFTATYSDREDSSIPDERLVWASSLDGRLGDGRSIWKNDLSPGRHTISFTATDSGGLSTSVTKELTVENHFPEATIELPVASGTFMQDVPITFRGRGYDQELGNLTGAALTWTYAGGYLGTGTQFQAPLAAGRHTIHLTATDGELHGRAEVTITVSPRSGDNAPPGVTITAPPHRSAPVGDRPGDCLTLTASAVDPEDGPLTGDALLWVDRPDGHPARTLAERGETIAACDFLQTGGDLWHSITVTATDSRGATATDSIRILVIGGGLI